MSRAVSLLVVAVLLMAALAGLSFTSIGVSPVPQSVPLAPRPANHSACPPHVPSPVARATCFITYDEKTMPRPAVTVFPDCLPHGFQQLSLDLFNPLEAWPPRLHHPLVAQWPQWWGPVDPEYMTDWLGIRTAFVHECAGGPGQVFNYINYVPSRRFQCQRHCDLLRAGVGTAPGEPPLFDDEYPEWVDMLSSLLSTPTNYVVVELGARLGTWGVRALAAHRLRHGANTGARFVGVESEASYYRWMQEHVRVNGMDAQSTLVHGLLGPRMTFGDLLSRNNLTHIDFLDIDIQSAELSLLDGVEARELLRERVAHIHVGTHTQVIHARLRDMFLEMKWLVTLDWAWNMRGQCDSALRDSLQTDKSCWTRTSLGPVYVRDGMLGFVNPAFIAAETMYQPIV